MLEALLTDRGARHGADRFRDAVDGVDGPREFEQGQPNVFLMLETNRDLLTDPNVGRFATDDVGGQVDSGILGQRHVGDDVRGIEARKPTMGVHGEPDDRATARHRRRLRRPAAAVRADWHRRVDELPAVVTALDAKDVVRSGLPEPLVRRRQFGKRSHHFPVMLGAAEAPALLISTSQLNAANMVGHLAKRGGVCPSTRRTAGNSPVQFPRIRQNYDIDVAVKSYYRSDHA